MGQNHVKKGVLYYLKGPFQRFNCTVCLVGRRSATRVIFREGSKTTGKEVLYVGREAILYMLCVFCFMQIVAFVGIYTIV